jgi:hypothetical protein
MIDVIINNNETVSIPSEIARMIPYFCLGATSSPSAKTSSRKALVGPLTVDFHPSGNCITLPSARHVRMIVKILEETALIPMIDTNSHQDAWIVINAATSLGVAVDTIKRGFIGWTTHATWTKLASPEYLYLLYQFDEDLVDFTKYFRVCSAKGITEASQLPELRYNPVVYVEAMSFLKNFELETCFEANDKVVRATLSSLKEARKAANASFLIDPHAEFMNEYFVYSPPGCDVWDRKGISIAAEPSPGDRTLASFDVARERFTQFTYGIFDKAPNPAIAATGARFPFANVVFAGGSITKILGAEFDPKQARQSDVDMFVIADSYAKQSAVFREIIDWFAGPFVYFASNGSVTTIYIRDIARKFQVITPENSSPFTVIARFDVTHIQWCFFENRFLGTPEACRAMREKVTRFNNLHRLKDCRLVKALYCGYSIHKNPDIIDNSIDITPLLADPTGPAMTKILRGFRGWWYPTSSNEFDDPHEETQHILCQIEKDANAKLVTDDPKIIKGNALVGGSFEGTYSSAMFSGFNPAMIVNQQVGRRITSLPLRSKYGLIYLTSATMKVGRIAIGENGVEIEAINVPDDFRRFTELLEGQVLRGFRAGGDVVNKLVADGKMTVMIAQLRLDMLALKDRSCLRSQRGETLNIDEDLHVGDDFQILFSIVLKLNDDDRGVTLDVSRIVKYQPLDVGHIIRAECFEDAPVLDTSNNLTNTDSSNTSSVIKYEALDY